MDPIGMSDSTAGRGSGKVATMSQSQRGSMDRAVQCISRFDKLRSMRYNWEAQWQEIRQLVRTSTTDFNRQHVQGDRRTEDIFDGTAPWALEQLAAHLNASLTPANEIWAGLGIDGLPLTAMNDDQLLWCQQANDRVFAEYQNPDVNHNPAMHECYLDVAAFGTGVVYQDWDWYGRHIFFKTFPLADCYVTDNPAGRIDTLYRKVRWSKKKIMEEFSRPGDTIPPELLTVEDQDKIFTVIHAVEPRGTSGIGKMQKPFRSCWCIVEFKSCLREGGYDEFPYHVPRWTKLADEPYGRSPGTVALPDIKMLNMMSKVVIKAAQKVIDPPLIVPDDGFMLPIKTSPASLIFKTAGQEDTIQPLETKGRIDIGIEMMDQRRDAIMKSFYVDWIIRQKKKERQTAAEVMDDRNEMLRQMGSILGRLLVELIAPSYMRTFNLLNAANQLPPFPDAMASKKLKLHFVSPAAKAMDGSKAQNIQAFTQDVVQFAQATPEIIDAVDTDVYAQEMAKFRDVDRRIIRTPDQIAARRDARNKQQQMQQLAATGKDTASAIKDLSVAQRNGMPIMQ